MQLFGKKLSSALLFGSMIFSTVDGAGVCAVDSEYGATVVEDGMNENESSIAVCSDGTEGNGTDIETNKGTISQNDALVLDNANVGNTQVLGENSEIDKNVNGDVVSQEKKSSGSKLGAGIIGALAGGAMGVGAEEAVRYYFKGKGKGSGSEVVPDLVEKSDSVEIERLKKELEGAKKDVEKAKKDLENAKKDLENAKKDLENKKDSLERAENDTGGVSLLDGLGALSYIPGLGSDAKTDSGINKGKLAAVITMHAIGLLAFCFEVWKIKRGYWSLLPLRNKSYQVIGLVFDVVCPPLGLVAHTVEALSP